MDTCILNPERKKGEPHLSRTGILAVNPADARNFVSLAQNLRLKRHFLFNSTLYSSDTLFLAGPAVGAPMAVMVLEKLIALGAENILLYSWAGSLHKEIRAMDIMVPVSGVSEEGTSCHYRSETSTPIAPDKKFCLAVQDFLAGQGMEFHTGPAWTTDAPYRETTGKVRRYSKQGVSGVDMEFTALCAAAAFRSVHLAAVMLISDELLHAPWTPHYSFKEFKKRSRDLLSLLCEGIESGIL